MKGLVISWFYPPINSSEGLVTFKLLNKSSISHDVFTQKDSTIWSYNASENALHNPSIKTIFGNSDSHEAWVQSCIEYFDKHHKEYDFIMSRSMPPESHEAALAIKRKYPHIKWIASFGDPIYNSPYTKIATPVHSYPISPVRFPYPGYFLHHTKRIIKKKLWYYQERGTRNDEQKKKILEQETFNHADTVIFNNPYQQEFMLAQHNLQHPPRSIVLPHPYEPSFYPSKKQRTSKEKVVFSHIGHLDWIRTPVNLLKAVRRLREVRPDLYKKVEINFYGILDVASKVYIVDHNLYDAITAHKPVTYFESLAIMKRSDWCLLVDANISSEIDKNIYFAAKLADYLGAGTPILALSMTDGASADIIRETGNILTSHSADEIYMNLVMILEQRLDHKPSTAEVQKFNAKDTAKLYDALVDELVVPSSTV